MGSTIFHTDGTTISNTSMSHRQINYLPVSEQSIPDFLAKPVFIKTGAWAATDVIGTPLYSLTAVSTLLAPGFNSGYYYNKIQGFNLIRFTACFQLILNANPFQQGKLIMAFSPLENQYTILRRRFQQVSQLTSLPNVEIDCRQANAILKIPYISPTSFYDLVSGQFDWGALELQVLSPLATGATGPQTADYAVAFWMEDVELAAPILPQMDGPPSRTKSKVTRIYGKEAEAHAQAKAGSITQLARATSLYSKSISAAIPSLSSIISPVSWLSTMVGSAASAMGWSKPLSAATSNLIMKQRLPHSANATGESFAVPLSLNHENKVETTDLLTPEDVDESSFAYIKRRYQYTNTLAWLATDAVGHNLYRLGIRPTNIYENDSRTISGHTLVTHNHPPFAHVANYFQNYRGSMKFILKFAKTDFHTGRLMVTFTPAFPYSNAVTIPNSTLSLREIVDIKGLSEVELIVPYLSNDPWTDVTEEVGTLDIYVMNELRNPETANNRIEILIYWGAGEDFELSCPTNAPRVPMMLQMDAGIVRRDPVSQVVGGQGYTSIPDDNLIPCRLTIGETFTSLRQLMTRQSVLKYTANLSFTNGFEYNPWYNTICTIDPATGVIVQPAIGFDTVSSLLSGFAFFRGTMRVNVQTATPQPAFAYLTQNAYSTPFSVASLTGATYGQTTRVTTAAQLFVSSVPVQTYDITEGNIETAVPYYNRHYFTFNDCTRDVFTSESAPRVRLGVYNNTTTAPNVYKCIGDDFQFGYFLGFFPTLYTYV